MGRGVFMPLRTKKPCAQQGCAALVTPPVRYCPAHLYLVKAGKNEKDKGRLTATQRGYGARWHKASRMYLNEHPFCYHCMGKGRTVPATLVDHIIPHKGNYDLFWDEENWQSLCTHCHNVKTAKEDGGFGNKKGIKNDR